MTAERVIRAMVAWLVVGALGLSALSLVWAWVGAGLPVTPADWVGCIVAHFVVGWIWVGGFLLWRWVVSR